MQETKQNKQNTENKNYQIKSDIKSENRRDHIK